MANVKDSNVTASMAATSASSSGDAPAAKVVKDPGLPVGCTLLRVKRRRSAEAAPLEDLDVALGAKRGR
jgi:hypothetical protein